MRLVLRIFAKRFVDYLDRAYDEGEEDEAEGQEERGDEVRRVTRREGVSGVNGKSVVVVSGS